MLSFLSPSKDIYFNLAAEEFLLKKKDEDFFLLWQSEECIVVGKHQNAMAEINHEFVRKHHIPVARRLTGGGTVFHGKGNLNFTFIKKGQAGRLVDFKSFVTPIVEYLQSLGIDARMGQKNEILIEGLKISGNAEHVFRKRVLHHGTLLFDADLKQLNQSIKIIPGRFKDKAVQSNRSEVTNIRDQLTTKIDFSGFQSGLFSFISNRFSDGGDYSFSVTDLEEIKALRDDKYASKTWIFGYSPEFEIHGKFPHEGGWAPMCCKVNKGVIINTIVESKSDRLNSEVSKFLSGKEFDFPVIERELKQSGLLSDDLIRAILAILF